MFNLLAISRRADVANVSTISTHLLLQNRKFNNKMTRIEQGEIGFTRRSMQALLKRAPHTPVFLSSNVLRVKLPGLAYAGFDPHGKKNIVNHLMVLQQVITMFWPYPTKTMDEQFMPFILNYDTTFHPSFYDKTWQWPIVIDNTVNFVKRSSRCHQFDIRQSEQTASMTTSRFIEVLVDPETRRPKPFPQWWKAENGFPEDGPQPNIEDVEKPGTGIVVTERRIYITDVDENNHTSMTIYVRLCLDTCYENVLNGNYMYSNNPNVIKNCWIRNFKLAFKAETKLGDVLTIESWEDLKSLNTFHFEIRKEQKITTTVSISFYSTLTEDRR